MDAQAIAARAAAFAEAVAHGDTDGRAEGVVWLQGALDEVGAGVSATRVRVLLAQAGRRLGDASAPVGEVVGDADLGAVWRACDAGRAALLLRAHASMDGEAWHRLVVDAVRRGEMSEQVSLLRMLAWLPDPARFCDVAVDACRTNAEPVFAAIAGENPYPAAHFPDGAFDQLVIKAIFVGVSIERIVGLSDRVRVETARIATDFADERRAAGRAVPADVDLVLQLVSAKAPGSKNA